MSKRTATRLAWSICALSLALTALSLLLITLILSYPNVRIFGYWLEGTVGAAAFPIVGAAIVSGHPNNVIGWLFCALGFSLGLNHFLSEYAIYALLAQPDSLPGGEVFAWLTYSLYVPTFSPIIFTLLLFPTGRLPSSRWRWFAGFSAIAILVGTVTASFSSKRSSIGPVPNPLGIESLGDVSLIAGPLLYALALLGAISMLGRLRRGTEIERQQIKWFAYAAAVTFIGGLVQHNLSPMIDVWWVWWVGFIIGTTGLIGTPIAMGIAILRYRLYEIDLIINRTLVYGALTATLALVYFGSVTLLQYLLSLLTGQGSTLAIVASTLGIAALFNPLRRRIQSFINRRFYRHKYDAAKTLEGFGSKLRDETDLERISGDLVRVVRQTIQPAHVSVWLRPTQETTSGEDVSPQKVK